MDFRWPRGREHSIFFGACSGSGPSRDKGRREICLKCGQDKAEGKQRAAVGTGSRSKPVSMVMVWEPDQRGLMGEQEVQK